MKNNRKYNRLIMVLSILMPLVVATLFGIKIDVELPVFLPPIYATINAITAFLIIGAVIAIKKGNRKLHERLIKIAMLCSVLFLLMYVLYHMTSNATPYGGEGFVKYIYYFVLISHILLSIGVIPVVLITYARAVTNDIPAHKKIAKYAFILWLYVAVTGVVVYLMIAPYY